MASQVVSEQIQIPEEGSIKRMGMKRASAILDALEARLRSHEGVSDPEEAAKMTAATNRLRSRIAELQRKGVERWEREKEEKRRQIEDLEAQIRTLQADHGIQTALKEQLDAELAAAQGMGKNLEGEWRALRTETHNIASEEWTLGARQQTELETINNEEAAELRELQTRFESSKAAIQGVAASRRLALQTEIAGGDKKLKGRQAANEGARALLASRQGKAAARQQAISAKQAALTEAQSATQDELAEKQSQLASAQAALEQLDADSPPEPMLSAPALLDSSELEPPAAATLEALAAMYDTIDSLEAFITAAQIENIGRLARIELGLDLVRVSIVNGKTNLAEILRTMEQGHGPILAKMQRDLAKAVEDLGKIDRSVMKERPIDYQESLDDIKLDLEESQAFYDNLMAWLKGDHEGPVPVLQLVDRAAIGGPGVGSVPGAEVPSAPPPAAAATPFLGLTARGAARVAALMDTESLGGDDADGALDNLDVDETGTGDSFPATQAAADAAITSPGAPLPQAPATWEALTEPRLPVLTPDEARQIRNDLRSSEMAIREDALKGLNNKEPSPEWVEILDLASRHHDPEIRRQVPRYAARLATFLSSDDLSHDRTLNAAGRNFFKTFPKDPDPSVANQATGYLNDLVRAKHFLPREVRRVAGIVTLYLKKRSDGQGIDDRGMERGNVLGLVRDLIEEVDDIHQAINESRPPRAATPTEQKTIERIHQFLYHLFKAVLNSPDRENYPETVINDILDILENFPYCLEYKAVCDLPLSNKEKITIMTGRTSDIVNGMKERIEDGVGIAEIHDEFRRRGFALKGEAEFFMWESITDAEVQARDSLIRATNLLDERLWGTEPSIELGDVEALLAETTAPNDSVLEQEISDSLDILFGEKGFSHTEKIFSAMGDVIANSTGDEVHIELSMTIAVEGERKWLSETAFEVIKEASIKIRQLTAPPPELNQRLNEADAKYAALAAMYNNQLSSFL